MNQNEIIQYDDKGNCIYYKGYDGYETWYEYNKNNQLIHIKSSSGFEKWYDRIIRRK